MYERFTDRARKVMQLANQEAQRLGHEYIAPEHVLVGIVKEGSGTAMAACRSIGVEFNLRDIRDAMAPATRPGSEMVTMGKLPQTPKCKAMVAGAIEQATSLQHNYVGTEHLLLALAADTESLTAKMLASKTVDDLRKAVVALLSGNSQPTMPPMLEAAQVCMEISTLFMRLATLFHGPGLESIGKWTVTVSPK